MHVETEKIIGQIGQRDETGQHGEVDPVRRHQPAQLPGPLLADRPAAGRGERNRLLAPFPVEGPDVERRHRQPEALSKFSSPARRRSVGDDHRRFERQPGVLPEIPEQRFRVGSRSAHEHGDARRPGVRTVKKRSDLHIFCHLPGLFRSSGGVTGDTALFKMPCFSDSSSKIIDYFQTPGQKLFACPGNQVIF